MGLTEGHWFEDEDYLSDRQFERAIEDEKAAYMRGLNDGKRMANWISVEENLPNGLGTVLIYTPRGGVSFGWFNGAYWERGAETKRKPIKTVTHWMPLPESPKE